jgi:hypothetical protein
MRLIIHGRQPLARRDDAIPWLLHPELHAGSHGFALVVKYYFSYKGSGALLLEASLSQDMDLINACTLVAVCRRGNPNAGGCRHTYLKTLIQAAQAGQSVPVSVFVG